MGLHPPVINRKPALAEPEREKLNMGIDGIGKRGGIGAGTVDPTVTTPGVEPENFALAEVSVATPAEPSAPLQQLARGEISVEAYLDARVEVATEHLRALLAEAELQFVRQGLLEQLRTDPVLLDLVRRVTGQDLDA